MLAMISMTTGIAAGVLFLVQAQKQPEKKKQLRGMATLMFGMALLMAIVFVF
ncbi:hypothetical protein BH10PSE17_BH10PSE17_02580 [soil metagenome]